MSAKDEVLSAIDGADIRKGRLLPSYPQFAAAMSAKDGSRPAAFIKLREPIMSAKDGNCYSTSRPPATASATKPSVPRLAMSSISPDWPGTMRRW